MTLVIFYLTVGWSPQLRSASPSFGFLSLSQRNTLRAELSYSPQTRKKGEKGGWSPMGSQYRREPERDRRTARQSLVALEMKDGGKCEAGYMTWSVGRMVGVSGRGGD